MKDETMNTEIEVTTEVSDGAEIDQEITIKETSGPSKGFIAAVFGGVVALGVGVGLAIRKHRKNKRLNEEALDEDFEDDFYDEYPNDGEVEETQATEVKSDDKETS